MRRGHWGSRLPGAGGERHSEGKGDWVAKVNWRALGQSAQAVGSEGGWWEARLWTPVRRLQRGRKSLLKKRLLPIRNNHV